MTCSVCGTKDARHEGGLLSMQPLCQVHFDKYKDLIQLIDVTQWPEEFVNARLKYLHNVKDRDTRLIAQLEKGSEKVQIVAETIALVGRSFKGVNFLRVPEIKSQDRVPTVLDRIKADLQECIRQLDEIETLRQNNDKMLPEVANQNNNNNIISQDLQIKQNERGSLTIEEARRMVEALDPKRNKSIDAKEFLAGRISHLPEPYLIVRDSPLLVHANQMGITFNNLATVINILARKYNYKIISTACDNHTMYVFMEKIGSLR